MKRLALILLILVPQAHATYDHWHKVTLNHTMCGGSDSTDGWPFMGTFSWMATTANGGRVRNTVAQSGGGPAITVPADQIITTDQAGTTPITNSAWYYVAWSATNGAVEMKIGITCNHTTDQVVYFQTGNAAVTTFQGSVNSTWPSSRKAVWSFGNGTTLDTHDATSNANTGTATGSPTANASGQLDGAMSLGGANGSGASSYVDAGNGSSVQVTCPGTIAAWVNPANFSNYGWVLAKTMTNQPGPYEYRINASTGIPQLLLGNGTTNFGSSGTTGVTAGVWSFIVVTWGTPCTNTSSAMAFAHYLNGAANGTSSIAFINAVNTANNVRIGTRADTFSFLNGSIEDVMLDNTALSADWVTAMYNAGHSNSSFWTVGPEDGSATRRKFVISQ